MLRPSPPPSLLLSDFCFSTPYRPHARLLSSLLFVSSSRLLGSSAFGLLFFRLMFPWTFLLTPTCFDICSLFLIRLPGPLLEENPLSFLSFARRDSLLALLFSHSSSLFLSQALLRVQHHQNTETHDMTLRNWTELKWKRRSSERKQKQAELRLDATRYNSHDDDDDDDEDGSTSSRCKT